MKKRIVKTEWKMNYIKVLTCNNTRVNKIIPATRKLVTNNALNV
jgi:hypothetical protein